jgi:hypothetical protein
MGNLETRGFGKMDNLSTKNAEALHTWRFLARVEEKLVAQADAEVGLIGTDPRLDYFPETSLPKLACTIPERADTGNHQGGTVRRVSPALDMDAFPTGMLDSALDASEIAAAVVD